MFARKVLQKFMQSNKYFTVLITEIFVQNIGLTRHFPVHAINPYLVKHAPMW